MNQSSVSTSPCSARMNEFVRLCRDAYRDAEARKVQQARIAPTKPRQPILDNGGIVSRIWFAYTLEELLLASGYTKRGKAYVSPHSTTGSPGVYVLSENGKERLYSHHGASDPLSHLNHDGHALDVADVLCVLEYGGDFNRMIRCEAQKLDPEGQAQRQREYREEQDEQQTIATFSDAPFSLKAFSLNGRSQAMREQMQADEYVMGRLAILGQMTVFYAKPNAGKTLLSIRLLIDAIQASAIDGDKIFYINADDNYRGLVEKLELAEKHGFNMLAPGHNDFRANDFLRYLERMILDETAKGVIVILDTLKKFTDPMDKKVSTFFGRIVRGFVSKGGTVIMLSHTNKNRNDEGKVVFSGTSDIVDDVDCAYTLDVTEEDHFFKTVVFENIKSRGDVAKEVAYQYAASASRYPDLIESVTEIDETEAQKSKERQQTLERLEANREAIEVICECIRDGVTKKTELIETAYQNAGISKANTRKVLKAHTGTDYAKGHRWTENKGEKATKYYSLIEPDSYASRYESASRGE